MEDAIERRKNQSTTENKSNQIKSPLDDHALKVRSLPRDIVGHLVYQALDVKVSRESDPHCVTSDLLYRIVLPKVGSGVKNVGI